MFFATRYFAPQYFAPAYFPGAEGEAGVAVGAEASRGDGLPIWIGVSSPPIPTLGMVGPPVKAIPLPTVRAPIHYRETVRVSLGTLYLRIVQETHTTHLRERIAVRYSERVISEKYDRREQGYIRSSLSVEARGEAIAWSHQEAGEVIGQLHETSAAMLTSQRIRMVRNEREAARISFALSAQSRTSFALCPTGQSAILQVTCSTESTESIDQHIAIKESFAVQTAYKLTRQPALTPSEAAAIAAIMAVLDEAA